MMHLKNEEIISMETSSRTGDGYFATTYSEYNTMPKGTDDQIRRKLIRKYWSRRNGGGYFRYERGKNNTLNYDKKRAKSNYRNCDDKQNMIYFCKNSEFSTEYDNTKAIQMKRLKNIHNVLDNYEYASTKKDADRIHKAGKKCYHNSEKFFESYYKANSLCYQKMHNAYIKMIIKDHFYKKQNLETV